jgi:predicted permease
MDEVLSYGLTVCIQVGILFLLILVGYLITKKGMLTAAGSKELTDILLFIVTPAIIIEAFMKVELGRKIIIELLIAAGCAFFTHLIGILAAFVFCKVKPLRSQAIYRFGVIFSNGGFMSLPLASALLPEKGVLLVSMYVIAINILTWTYGVTLFPSVKNVSKIKALVNPGTIGVVLGIPFMFISPDILPKIISEPVSYIAGLNTPVAMILTGFFLVNSGVIDGLRDKKMWCTVALRLLFVPLAAFAVFRFLFGLSGDLIIAVMIPACAPVAVNTTILSAKFDGDTALASRMMSLSTLLSIITIPLILMITKI